MVHACDVLMLTGSGMARGTGWRYVRGACICAVPVLVLPSLPLNHLLSQSGTTQMVHCEVVPSYSLHLC